MHDTLGLAGAAGGVQHEQRVLGLDPLAVAVRGDLVHLVVPPRVSAVNHRTLAREAFVHDDGLDGEIVFAQLQRGVDLGLELHRLGAAHHRVARHDNLALRVRHPAPDSLGAEPAKHHGVNRSDASASQTSECQLHDHGHVERDGIALLDPFRLQDVGELLDLVEDVVVGVRRLLVW